MIGQSFAVKLSSWFFLRTYHCRSLFLDLTDSMSNFWYWWRLAVLKAWLKHYWEIFFVKSVEFRVILTKYTAENLIEDVQMFFCLIEMSFSRMDEAEVAKWWDSADIFKKFPWIKNILIDHLPFILFISQINMSETGWRQPGAADCSCSPAQCEPSTWPEDPDYTLAW